MVLCNSSLCWRWWLEKETKYLRSRNMYQHSYWAETCFSFTVKTGCRTRDIFWRVCSLHKQKHEQVLTLWSLDQQLPLSIDNVDPLLCQIVEVHWSWIKQYLTSFITLWDTSNTNRTSQHLLKIGLHLHNLIVIKNQPILLIKKYLHIHTETLSLN